MRVAIVDDEPLARLEARRLLGKLEVTVVGDADGVETALALLRQQRVDVVLLDIDLAGRSGFDVLAELDDPPDVVFTTAHSSHAVQAFSVGAVDYCMKPLQLDRLQTALERVRAKLPAVQRLLVKERDTWSFVALADVLTLEAEGNFTRLVTATQSPWVGKSLTQLEATLDPQTFFRVSRQTIVNVAHVQKLHDGITGLDAVLTNGTVVRVSRRRASDLRHRFGV